MPKCVTGAQSSHLRFSSFPEAHLHMYYDFCIQVHSAKLSVLVSVTYTHELTQALAVTLE